MELYYYHAPGGNFGDSLNSWLWPALLPARIEDCFDADTLLLGVGTILNDHVPATPSKKLVFSSGYGYGSLPQITDQWKFYCVRGPLTAEALSLPKQMAITDGAALIRGLLTPNSGTQFRAAYIPHHWNAFSDDWKEVCESASIFYIDPRRDAQEVTRDICASSLVITEAMHGVILADVYRIPWIPIRTRSYINEFKWRDWSASIGVEQKFEWLPPIWSTATPHRAKRALHAVLAPVARERLRWLVNHGKPRLSKTSVFEQVYGRLTERLAQLTEDIRQQNFAIET